eukprot:1160797-Pelagomonas_calceolata.AAC.6
MKMKSTTHAITPRAFRKPSLLQHPCFLAHCLSTTIIPSPHHPPACSPLLVLTRLLVLVLTRLLVLAQTRLPLVQVLKGMLGLAGIEGACSLAAALPPPPPLPAHAEGTKKSLHLPQAASINAWTKVYTKPRKCSADPVRHRKSRHTGKGPYWFCFTHRLPSLKGAANRQTRRGCGSKGKEGQGFIAAPAYKGNLAKAKRWWRSSKSHRCGNRDSKRSKKKRGRTHTRMHNNDTLRSAHTCEVTMSIQEKDHQRGLEPRRMLMELIPRRS